MTPLKENLIEDIQKISESELTLDELESVRMGLSEYRNGECLDFEDYLSSRQ